MEKWAATSISAKPIEKKFALSLAKMGCLLVQERASFTFGALA